MNYNDLTDDINELVRIFTKSVEKLPVNIFKDYYKQVYGEDNFYLENNLDDMYECLTDPYTLWEAEPEVLKEEIKKVDSLVKEQTK